MGIQRAEVIEVYNDLSALTVSKIDQLMGNAPEPAHLPPLDAREAVIKLMPRDSLRVRILGSANSIICYPFFPSHLRFPVKVGEEVWVFLESFDSSSPTQHDPERGTSAGNIKDIVMNARNQATTPKENSVVGFWMCRPTQSRHIEDVNFAAFGRTKNKSSFEMTSAAELSANTTRTGGRTFPSYSENETSQDTVNKEDERLATRMRDFSPAKFSMEPVARYTKQPGETVIAGSNDARIVLGQTRSGRPTSPTAGSGAIDIVVGTGGSSSNAPITISNPMGSEVDKDPGFTGKVDNPQEGDPDLRADLSRIHISESADVDQLFMPTVASISGADTSAKSGPSAVVRAQHVRISSGADGSVRIVVEGSTQSNIVIDSSGNIQISGSSIAIGSSGAPQVLVNGATGAVAIAASQIVMGPALPGAAPPVPTSGVVNGTVLMALIMALKTDLLGAPGLPPTPTGPAALPATTTALAAIIATDPTLANLFSKTVFASS